ncbi:MAG: hypothetical protein FJY65_03420 [Calditrichaeota bacterium]|nr:hypothetical protein [Calditrichota bacterium]
MATTSAVYRRSLPGRIFQCEILSDFPHYIPLHSQPTLVKQVNRSLVMGLSQDCDLEQDYNLRNDHSINVNEKEAESQYLPFLILLELFTEDRIRSERKYLKSDIWRKIRDNNDERYQYLRVIQSEDDLLNEGIPASVIDFKRSFTVETSYVYHSIQSGNIKRRSIVKTPYAEAILSRFGNYISRVALPAPHYISEANPT